MMHIAGSNFTKHNYHFENSYGFSSIAHVWGWATWKRAWQKFKLEPDEISNLDTIRFFTDENINSYWKAILRQTIASQTNTWDYSWVLTILRNQGLCIYPSVNLVTNIGIYGTHGKYSHGNPSLNIPAEALGEISHPQNIKLDRSLDSFSHYNVFDPPKKHLPNQQLLHFSLGRVSVFHKMTFHKSIGTIH